MELRPLNFGEIFDRAVTIYVKNFLPFAAIVIVLIVPLAILQYLYDLSAQPQLNAIFRIFAHPGSVLTTRVPSSFNTPAGTASFVGLLLVTYALWPFTLNAVAVGVARVYRGRPVEFRACYEAVMHRWLQILGMIAMDLVIFIGWYAVTLIVLMVVGGLLAFLALATGGALAVAITIAVIAILLILPSLAALFVALTFAMYATVIEEQPVFESLGLGFSRVFNKAEFWRALLFALAVLAVMIAGAVIFGFIGLFAASVHLPLLQALIESLERAVVTPFATILLAIYYFDVRIRREAFDLETHLERLAAAQPA
jgi:hypothetical protein